MTDIIFEYTPPVDTNWLNPDWRKTEGKRLAEIHQEEQIRLVDMLNPNMTDKQKSKELKMNHNHYMKLRRKYKL